MPVFLSPTTEKEALCYFTILSLNKNSVKVSHPIYERVRTESDWEYALENLGYIRQDIEKAKKQIINGFKTLDDYDLVVQRGESLYPKRLNKVNGAPHFLFLRGEPLLLNEPVISVVGSRKASEEGINRARRLARLLSERRIIVASGLARGIDKAAHHGTYDAGKPTIAVIGTPLNKVYPKEHEAIQNYIGQKGLVVSQFAPGTPVQRWNFPMRNATMSGISIATIVVEAGETSGALIQAREALKQGREVFIPQSALDNPKLSWPKKFVYELGANKFTTIDDLMEQLQKKNLIQSLTESRENLSTITTLRLQHAIRV
jgi:DNA processing protein